MKRPTCETCVYWKCYDPDDAPNDGWCQKRPPQYLAAHPDHDPSRDMEWMQPSTAAGDSCGEHHDFPAYLAWFRQQADVAPPAAEA